VAYFLARDCHQLLCFIFNAGLNDGYDLLHALIFVVLFISLLSNVRTVAELKVPG